MLDSQSNGPASARLVPWYERAEEDEGWVDHSIDAWKDQFGGDAAFDALRDQDMQPVDPSLGVRLVEWCTYRLNQLRIGALFTIKILRDGRRGTHECGVAMSGTLRVVDDVDIPANSWLRGGRAFDIFGRFASVALDDETFALARGMGLSLTPTDDTSDTHAFGLNSSTASVFWNQHTFWKIARGTISVKPREGKFDGRKKVYGAQPQAFWGSVWTTRLRVTSFAHLAYYSQQAYKFVASDGQPRYIKFAVVPSASNGGPASEAQYIMAGEEQRSPWDQTGEFRDVDRKAPDYLSAEIRERLAAGEPLEFELRAQIWDRRESDPLEVLALNYEWRVPWKTVATLSFDRLLDAEPTRKLNFKMGTITKTGVLALPDVEGWHGARTYASIAWSRLELEAWSVRLRGLRHRLMGGEG